MDASASRSKPRRRWFQYSLRTLLALVTAVAAWLGWQNHLERVRLAKEADAREAVFREVIDGWRKHSYRHKVTAVFVAFGLDEKTATFLDPPHGFLDRFHDLNIDFQPASGAKLPDAGRIDAIEERVVRDPKTGAACSILSAGIIRWIDDHTIELDVELYGGILNGNGYHATVQLQDGKWQIIAESEEWVS